MNELIEILSDLHDDVDFATETGLIENGILNSLVLISFTFPTLLATSSLLSISPLNE